MYTLFIHTQAPAAAPPRTSLGTHQGAGRAQSQPDIEYAVHRGSVQPGRSPSPYTTPYWAPARAADPSPPWLGPSIVCSKSGKSDGRDRSGAGCLVVWWWYGVAERKTGRVEWCGAVCGVPQGKAWACPDCTIRIRIHRHPGSSTGPSTSNGPAAGQGPYSAPTHNNNGTQPGRHHDIALPTHHLSPSDPCHISIDRSISVGRGRWDACAVMRAHRKDDSRVVPLPFAP
jgi:hypothetical protein